MVDTGTELFDEPEVPWVTGAAVVLAEGEESTCAR
jgi:hypothetical protein